MQIFQALIEMAWWARLKVLPSNVLMFFPSALFRSKKTFQKCLKMGNTHFMYGNFNEQWWWSSGIRWIWGYPNPIFTETKKAQGTGSHHPSPSIRPLGLRGKEFGWLADDLQQPTKTHFGYSKIKKKKQFVHPFVPWKIHANIFKSCDPDFIWQNLVGCGHRSSHTGNPWGSGIELRIFLTLPAPGIFASTSEVSKDSKDSKDSCFTWFTLYGIYTITSPWRWIISESIEPFSTDHPLVPHIADRLKHLP